MHRGDLPWERADEVARPAGDARAAAAIVAIEDEDEKGRMRMNERRCVQQRIATKLCFSRRVRMSG